MSQQQQCDMSHNCNSTYAVLSVLIVTLKSKDRQVSLIYVYNSIIPTCHQHKHYERDAYILFVIAHLCEPSVYFALTGRLSSGWPHREVRH